MDATWTDTAVLDGDGTPIFHRECGAGPPVLLLHGFPQTGECWRKVASRLAASHRVLVPDLPGYGASGRPPAFDAGTIARVLVGYLRSAGVERATIVGHDWGGAMAYRIASRHPDVTERLVAINSPYGKIDLRRGWYMIAFNLPVLPEVALTLSRGRLIEWFLRAGVARPDAFTDDDVAAYRDAFASLERTRNALAYYRTITRQALLRPLRRPSSSDGPRARISAPTMIVWGEADPALPVTLAEGIVRAIPGAVLERLPGVGHFVPEEAPEELARLIAGFAAA